LLLVVAGVTALALMQPRGDVARSPSLEARASPQAPVAEELVAPSVAEETARPSRARSIAIFTQLRGRLDRAITRRNARLLPSIFGGRSVVERRTRRVIANLRRDGVVDLTKVKTVRVVAVARSAEEIRVRDATRLRPCFRNEHGRDVTDAPALLRQTGEWTLRRGPTGWRIVDGALLRDRIVRRRPARC
jgi:hypothetical protein